ncbi:MAG: transposase [Bacteroidetes bacterium]|nr:MAG: transposase [Bacteroidota bacterium]
MKKRIYSKEEKMSILQEASEQGVTRTLEKYGIYPATYYSWKKKYEQMGEEGLKHGMTKAHLKRIRELEKENRLLKELLAEKELEGRLKDEMIKKKYALRRKKNS